MVNEPLVDRDGLLARPAYAVPAPAEKSAPQSGESAYTVVKPTWAQQTKAVQQADAGLASLDFELPGDDPSRWTLYRFTTPRGDEQIAIRNVSNDLVWRLVAIVLVAVAVLVLLVVAGMTRRGLFHWMTHPVVAALLVCFGVLSLCGGLLPIVGVIALVAGCGILIQRAASPKVATI
jgi:hypothetical protein